MSTSEEDAGGDSTEGAAAYAGQGVGAVAGAAIGSIVPGVGTAVGAVVGVAVEFIGREIAAAMKPPDHRIGVTTQACMNEAAVVVGMPRKFATPLRKRAWYRYPVPELQTDIETHALRLASLSVVYARIAALNLGAHTQFDITKAKWARYWFWCALREACVAADLRGHDAEEVLHSFRPFLKSLGLL